MSPITLHGKFKFLTLIHPKSHLIWPSSLTFSNSLSNFAPYMSLTSYCLPATIVYFSLMDKLVPTSRPLCSPFLCLHCDTYVFQGQFLILCLRLQLKHFRSHPQFSLTKVVIIRLQSVTSLFIVFTDILNVLYYCEFSLSRTGLQPDSGPVGLVCRCVPGAQHTVGSQWYKPPNES